ncbi:MAG: hypothetical protein Q8O15_09775 [Rectinemataceae bacterium]|nr:hypothetical protein [Rectinemataceae bacterium]
MNAASIAPCGIICDICLGFQRGKNRCVGCNASGNKPNHCAVCGIKTCPEKNGDERSLCNSCIKYPCRRIKDLDKRYRIKYGENIIRNFESIRASGIDAFIAQEEIAWKCPRCENLLCVHRETCLICGSPNERFPKKS